MIDSRLNKMDLARLAPPILAALALSMTGCASSVSYAGIDLRAGRADPAIQQLAIRAQNGDQQALLHLAASYDYGIGVPINRDQAIRLYRLAARSDPGSMYVWVPDGSGGGRVHRLEYGAPRLGSVAAQARLQVLEAE